MVMTQDGADKIAYLVCIGEALKFCEAKGITEDTACTELLRSEIVEDFAKEFILNFCRKIKKDEAIEFTKFVFSDVIKALAKMPKEEVRTINLGSNPGIEINREIMKKRIGFVYGK